MHDPGLLRTADSDLWNDRLYLQIDHLGKIIRSGWMNPDLTQYSQPLRAFYLRDNRSGEIWTVPQALIRRAPDAFEFSAGKSDIVWVVEVLGIRCTVRVVVPVKDAVELWTVTVENRGTEQRSLSLFSYFPVGKLSWFRQDAQFDPGLRGIVFNHFPYYVDYRDYKRLSEGCNAVFLSTDTVPDAWMTSVEDFLGRGTSSDPESLRGGALPGPDRWADADTDSAGILQFDLGLEAGVGKTYEFAFGPCQTAEEARELTARYLGGSRIESALREAEAQYDDHPPALEIRTPDAGFDAYINHWLPRRVLMLARGMRFMSAPQGRNLLQDAMGAALVEPASARRWFLRFYAFQKQDGWLPHGMPLEPGATQIRINTIPHKDINSWGPSAIVYYLNETGDLSILDEEVPFSDAPGCRASLFEHVCRGLDWLLNDRTPRGLSRIGQGDWNDPLNMAGHGEKGESIWLSEALSLALDTWAPVCEERGDCQRAAHYSTEAEALRECINSLAWDGEWYLRGFTDAGRPFGTHTDAEGRIFLNAQSWAILCGAAGPGRIDACVASVEKYLETPSGPMMLAPAFTVMREDIGKLSQKAPGRLENGSVYCHAATFYACALIKARRGDAAFRVLHKLLTGSPGNPLQRSGQLPLYIPNSYHGAACGRKAGLTSRSPNTGTAAWYYRAVLDGLVGMRAEGDTLVIDPQLPDDWKEIHATRRWRGALFEAHMERRPGITEPVVHWNGRECPGRKIPLQPPGSRHQLHVLLPVQG